MCIFLYRRTRREDDNFEYSDTLYDDRVKFCEQIINAPHTGHKRDNIKVQLKCIVITMDRVTRTVNNTALSEKGCS